MKKISLVLIAMMFCFASFSQTKKKPTQISESLYILPKAGMNLQFEAAIAAHNEKFHPVGPHHAVLRRIEYGAKSGWYSWIMKGTYASLDSRPVTEGGHQEDWDKNVGPTVEEYGDVGLWAYDEDLSFGADIFKKSKKYLIWSIDVKRGKSDRFKVIVEKLREAYKSIGTRAMLVYTNEVHTSGSADIALIWTLENYADLDSDWKTKEAFEKINGEGSWEKMVAEWYDTTVDHEEEIRTML